MRDNTNLPKGGKRKTILTSYVLILSTNKIANVYLFSQFSWGLCCERKKLCAACTWRLKGLKSFFFSSLISEDWWRALSLAPSLHPSTISGDMWRHYSFLVIFYFFFLLLLVFLLFLFSFFLVFFTLSISQKRGLYLVEDMRRSRTCGGFRFRGRWGLGDGMWRGREWRKCRVSVMRMWLLCLQGVPPRPMMTWESGRSLNIFYLTVSDVALSSHWHMDCLHQLQQPQQPWMLCALPVTWVTVAHANVMHGLPSHRHLNPLYAGVFGCLRVCWGMPAQKNK